MDTWFCDFSGGFKGIRFRCWTFFPEDEKANGGPVLVFVFASFPREKQVAKGSLEMLVLNASSI